MMKLMASLVFASLALVVVSLPELGLGGQNASAEGVIAPPVQAAQPSAVAEPVVTFVAW